MQAKVNSELESIDNDTGNTSKWDLSTIVQRHSYVVAFGHNNTTTNRELNQHAGKPLINKNVRGMRLRPRQTMCEICKQRVADGSNESGSRSRRTQKNLETAPKQTVVENGRKKNLLSISKQRSNGTEVDNFANNMNINGTSKKIDVDGFANSLQNHFVHKLEKSSKLIASETEKENSHKMHFGAAPYRVKLRLRTSKDGEKHLINSIIELPSTSSDDIVNGDSVTDAQLPSYAHNREMTEEVECLKEKQFKESNNRRKRRKLAADKVTRCVGIEKSNDEDIDIVCPNKISKPSSMINNANDFLNDNDAAKCSPVSDKLPFIDEHGQNSYCEETLYQRHELLNVAQTSLGSWDVYTSAAQNGTSGIRLSLKKKFDWSKLSDNANMLLQQSKLDSFGNVNSLQKQDLSTNLQSCTVSNQTDDTALTHLNQLDETSNEIPAESLNKTSNLESLVIKQRRTVLRINLNKQLIIPLSPSPKKSNSSMSDCTVDLPSSAKELNSSLYNVSENVISYTTLKSPATESSFNSSIMHSSGDNNAHNLLITSTQQENNNVSTIVSSDDNAQFHMDLSPVIVRKSISNFVDLDRGNESLHTINDVSSTLSIGSIMWGKLPGCPWWPCQIVALQKLSAESEQTARVHWFCSSLYTQLQFVQLRSFVHEFCSFYNRHRRGLYKHAVRQARLVSRRHHRL